VRARRPFAWYGVLGVAALALIAGFLVMIVVDTVLIATYAPTHPVSPLFARREALGIGNAGSARGQSLCAAVYVTIGLVLLFFLPRLAKAPLETLGFRRLHGRDVFPVVVAIATTETLSFVYGQILVALHLAAHRQAGFEHVRFHGAVDIAVSFAVICLVAPAVEETIFRVFLLNAFAAWMPFGVAAIASAGLFAWAHLDGVFGPLLFCNALVLTAVYRYTRSIYASMILHGVGNFTALLFFVIVPRA
jgi:membrane protease YdiL (CAAX protease family)